MDTITQSYLECALWSSINFDDEEERPLDEDYDVEDVAPASVEKAEQEIADFRKLAGDDLEGLDEEQIGHDLWLTRNGHGAGFWDRGLGERGERLSEHAQSLGTCDPYVGDDGLIYID